MPDPIRLPGHVPDGEVRVYWDKTDEGDDLYTWGPPSMRRFALMHFTEKQWAPGHRFMARRDVIEQGLLAEKPSFLDRLEEEGYDPRTLVFSIRKKGQPEPPTEVPDDIRKRLEDAQMALAALSKALGKAEEAKDVYVLSEGDRSDIEEAVGAAESAVESALDLLDGREVGADQQKPESLVVGALPDDVVKDIEAAEYGKAPTATGEEQSR